MNTNAMTNQEYEHVKEMASKEIFRIRRHLKGMKKILRLINRKASREKIVEALYEEMADMEKYKP